MPIHKKAPPRLAAALATGILLALGAAPAPLSAAQVTNTVVLTQSGEIVPGGNGTVRRSAGSLL